MSEDIFFGIDVCKARLDIARVAEPSADDSATLPARVDNEENARAALVAQLKRIGPKLVVLEATGGFETALAGELFTAVPVAVLNPKRVRDFARAAGILAKTDRLDAKVLALFAQRMRPEPRAMLDETQQEISELVDRRAQLVAIRAQEKTRLATVKPVARKSVREHIAWLDMQIGRGPFADDSGKRRGQRYVQGGRADVRCAAVHGRAQCLPMQSRNQKHVRAIARAGQALQGRPDRLHAQAAYHLGRHPEHPTTMEEYAYRKIVVDTVALPAGEESKKSVVLSVFAATDFLHWA